MSRAQEHQAILCIGRVYCDLIFTDLPRMPTAGTEVFAGGLNVHAGGGAAITAGHLAALGHQSALAAFLPGQGFGDVVMRELQAVGVDLNLCQQEPDACSPQLTVALVQNGERAFVTHRTGPAFPELPLPALTQTPPRHIHIGEAATLTDTPGLIELAKRLGATLSLDCSWDDNLDAKTLARLLPEIDVFFPNAAEVDLLRRLRVPEPFCDLTVIKQGAAGATAHTRDATHHAPAVATHVVDTTGAGDAFNAAFLGCWLQGGSIAEALQQANARGGQTVAQSGGLGGCLPAF